MDDFFAIAVDMLEGQTHKLNDTMKAFDDVVAYFDFNGKSEKVRKSFIFIIYYRIILK